MFTLNVIGVGCVDFFPMSGVPSEQYRCEMYLPSHPSDRVVYEFVGSLDSAIEFALKVFISSPALNALTH